MSVPRSGCLCFAPKLGWHVERTSRACPGGSGGRAWQGASAAVSRPSRAELSLSTSSARLSGTAQCSQRLPPRLRSGPRPLRAAPRRARHGPAPWPRGGLGAQPVARYVPSPPLPSPGKPCSGPPGPGTQLPGRDATHPLGSSWGRGSRGTGCSRVPRGVRKL